MRVLGIDCGTECTGYGVVEWNCREELERLKLTHTALVALSDEEMPQRIGFVSDKVFDPSPVRRWFAGFWTSTARLGFVSAAMLSGAILVHTVRPVQIGRNTHKDAQSAQTTQAEINRQIDVAVQRDIETDEFDLFP